MNITFNDNDIKNSGAFINLGTASNNSVKTTSTNNLGVTAEFGMRNLDNAYRNKKSINDVLNNADMMSMNMDAQRDYMTVMSNCVSDEDFMRMQKDGFKLGSTKIEETETIVDHVKAAVMKGGTVVYGYTDTISDEALTDITGSKTYANELKKQFIDKDIPLNEDTVKDIKDNYDKLTLSGAMSDSTKKYLVENDMDPTVENIYTATFASGNNAKAQGHGYFAQADVAGYYAKKPENIDVDALRPQIENIIRETNNEVNDENVNAALWLIDKGVPLTKDTFSQYKKLNEVNLPMEFTEFSDIATNAIVDLIPVKNADLSRKTSFRQEAININNEVQNLGTIKGRRVLEEVRLSMTVEANFRLLKSGYAIDTAPMEELVKNLKEIEKEFAINLTHDEDEINAVRKKNIFDDTVNLVDYIKSSPISISLSYEYEDTLSIVGDKSRELTNTYAKANESYEALMTAPRADMKDSIQTAFRNIDEILSDLDIPLTEENKRAVRVLGYNSMELTSENISKVALKDKLLTSTLNMLTPGRVLNMIRSNDNPLLMSVSQLNEYLMSQDTVKEDMMSYSKFLYKLEKSKDITSEEREAYIGIYRLINQIEKSDFSSVGAIENANMEFNFENILSTLRSKKHKSMDYKVDDNFGGIQAVDKGIESISSQIMKGFISDTKDLKDLLDTVGDERIEHEFEKQQLEEIKAAFKAEDEVIEQLKNMNTPITSENIADMEIMMNSPASVFKRLRDIGYKKNFEIKLDSRKDAKESFKAFTGSIKDFLNNEVFGSNDDINALKAMDVKLMSQMYQHMDFLERQSDEENYEVPTSINGELTAINLKVIHSDINSEVAISFESNTFGNVAAQFSFKDNGLSGYLSCSDKDGSTLLDDNKELLLNNLRANDISINDIHFIENKGIDLKEFNNKVTQDRKADTDVISTDELYMVAKTFISFVQSIATK